MIYRCCACLHCLIQIIFGLSERNCINKAYSIIILVHYNNYLSIYRINDHIFMQFVPTARQWAKCHELTK